MTDRERPTYCGIRTYQDPGGRFQFRYPSDWCQYELSEGKDGVLYSPESQGPQTWFAVWSTRLQDAVMAGDLDLLREGVDEGLYQLPGLSIESRSEDVYGNLIRFERIYTFRENGTVRKRKVWMIYVYKWLFALVAQGATVDEYGYWYPMLGDCMDSFNLPPELWFASDPELAGNLR